MTQCKIQLDDSAVPLCGYIYIFIPQLFDTTCFIVLIMSYFLCCTLQQVFVYSCVCVCMLMVL